MSYLCSISFVENCIIYRSRETMMIKELEIFFTHINRLMLHQDNRRNLGIKETIVMSQDCPKKWDGLAIAFVIQYIRCFRNFWGFANILLHIPLKMGKKNKKIVSPAFSLKLKNFVFDSWLNLFIQMVIFTTLFWRCPTLWKSMLKITTLFRRCLTLLKSMLK